MIQRPVSGFVLGTYTGGGHPAGHGSGAWEFQCIVPVIKAFAHGNLLLGELRTRILEVVVAQRPVNFGLRQQVLHDSLHFVAVRVLTKGSAVAPIRVLAPEIMGLQQVVEPCRVHLSAGLHWLVQALLVELGFVQPVLEVLLAKPLDLGRFTGPPAALSWASNPLSQQ